MEGGEITGNSVAGGVSANGGGVYVDNGSVFIMKTGKISGNSLSGGEDATLGGGVMVNGDSLFTMEGGEISGNNATSQRVANGGGVRVAGQSTFTMKGGKISGNSVSGDEPAGGGVCVQPQNGTQRAASMFIMEGGTVYGSASAVGAGGDANEFRDRNGTPVAGRGAALWASSPTLPGKWGTGGTYTKGGVPQSGGSTIGSTDETLIAGP